MKAQSFQVRSLKNQIAACLRLIALHAKSAILKLVDLEVALESALIEQIQYSEAQIKEAFVKANGCIKRYWQPEMLELIPQLIGLKIRGCDPWSWMSQFAPIQKMDELGWSDRHMVYCIDASKILVGQNPY